MTGTDNPFRCEKIISINFEQSRGRVTLYQDAFSLKRKPIQKERNIHTKKEIPLGILVFPVF